MEKSGKNRRLGVRDKVVRSVWCQADAESHGGHTVAVPVAVTAARADHHVRPIYDADLLSISSEDNKREKTTLRHQ